MTTKTNDRVRDEVREHYGNIARSTSSQGCGTGCCSGASTDVGYREEELASVPVGADMGLGCGTPLAFAGLREGDIVLDLGSGGGIDCFLAARQVGPGGRVIGVDMTPEMIQKARNNAARVSATNVEFRLGEIERLPVADRSVDVVVSNCVINLSPQKQAVLSEAFRVLRPGGRVAISDILAFAPLPDEIRLDQEAYAACVSGAATIDETRDSLASAGFVNINIDMSQGNAENYVASATITAERPTAP